MFKVGDKVVRTSLDGLWEAVCKIININFEDSLTVKKVLTDGSLNFDELPGSFDNTLFKLVKPKDSIIMRNIIKYQIFDTQSNKVVNTFDTLNDAEDTLYQLNKSAINIGEKFGNGNMVVKVENVNLVSDKVEVVIYHCGQPFYSSYDLGKFLVEFKKCH